MFAAPFTSAIMLFTPVVCLTLVDPSLIDASVTGAV